MSYFFDSNHIFRISKISTNYPSFRSMHHEEFDDQSQQKNKDFDSMKDLLKSTISMVESLKTEIYLMQYENKKIQQNSLEYIKVIHDEYAELKTFIKDIHIDNKELLLRQKAEILAKIDENVIFFIGIFVLIYYGLGLIGVRKKLGLSQSIELIQRNPENIKEKKKLSNMKYDVDLSIYKNSESSSLTHPSIFDLFNNFKEKNKGLYDLNINELKYNKSFTEVEEAKEKTSNNHNIDAGLCEPDILVYRTTFGAKYHKKTCGYLHSSCIEISLKEAQSNRLGPCSRCCPPK